MICPKCSGKTGVYNGLENEGNYLRRRRCLNCGYKFITVEKVTDVEIQGNGGHGGKRVPWSKILPKVGGRSE